MVENVRAGRRIFQRRALYLGELNDSQRAECEQYSMELYQLFLSDDLGESLAQYFFIPRFPESPENGIISNDQGKEARMAIQIHPTALVDKNAQLGGEHPPQKETATQIETATGRVAASTGPVKVSVHNKVQLWEDGPYWADTNIGAEKPEDYGFYFWWGDTVGYKHEGDVWVASDGSSLDFDFGEGHTPTCGKSLHTLKSEGWVIGGEERKSLLGKLFGVKAKENSVLTTKHDAAQVHWGGEWRMPTNQELKDLCNKCDWTWSAMNGVNGYVVRGRGNYASGSIFLPCAGFGHEVSLGHAGSTGAYWASVPHSDYNDSEAWDLGFNSGSHSVSYYYRYFGQSIRPVQGFTK